MFTFTRISFSIILFLVLRVEGKQSIFGGEDEELDKQLKLLNKPALKTIKTEYGDIIDCIDIYKQPSLDHPLLKNHTIQMKPSSFPRELKGPVTPLSSSSNLVEMELRRTECPRGTVPISRIQKEDLIRIRSFSKRDEAKTDSDDVLEAHIAACYIQADPNKPVHGGSTMISIYNPKLTSKEDISGATMWIQGSDFKDQYNSIQVGWIVSPDIYGDNQTRLYTRWTLDVDDKTGCYNILCPGFVQVGSTPLNQVLEPVTHDGKRNVLDLLVFKDPKTKNWWFAISKSRTLVGYWPASLFTIMKDNAAQISWGGLAGSLEKKSIVEMGSGKFLSNQDTKTCFAGRLQVVDEKNYYADLSNFKVETSTDKPDWYGVNYRKYTDKTLQYNVLFGGPVMAT